ncbi:MAG: FAD:protein FMN transferase, partial [Halothiobacillaceae bacterium]
MPAPVIRRMRPLLGTFVEIHARAPAVLAEAGIEAAFSAIDEVQRQMSFFDPDSDLSRINLHAWRKPVAVNPSTFRVLLLARHVARNSRGLFDFSVGGRLVRTG